MLFTSTVKALLIAQAFVRIITFYGERSGCLLEATVLTNNILTTKTSRLFNMVTIVVVVFI